MLESLTDPRDFLVHARYNSFSALYKAVAGGLHHFRMILTRAGVIYVDFLENDAATAADDCLQTLKELKNQKLSVVLDKILATH